MDLPSGRIRVGGGGDDYDDDDDEHRTKQHIHLPNGIRNRNQCLKITANSIA